jgi:PAS domain S-box-containing protein
MRIVSPLPGKPSDTARETPATHTPETGNAGRPVDDDLTGRFVASADWRLIDSNPALADLLGHRPDESLTGQSLLQYVADPLILESLLARARVERRAGPVECRLRRRDGIVIDASCIVSAATDTEDRITTVRGQLLDVSEQRRLQMQLGGAARMELFARFAGGLAHDFNNLLVSISGHAQRLARELPGGTALQQSASEVCEAAGRATLLTQQLLAFSRRQVFVLQALDLVRLIEDARPRLEQLLGPDISLRVDASGAVSSIEADPAQLVTILTNLATNAHEAMAGHGTLTLRVDAYAVDEPPAEKRWLRPGDYVRLTVADTGAGMDAVARTLAFHPFFSTKGLGNGRGLGLAMVYGIVKQSRGFVWVESEPGGGAAFTLLFPAHLRTRPIRAGETILVIEPDDQLRSMIAEVLRARGYEVLEAGTTEDALPTFALRSGAVRLVVTADSCDEGADRPLLARLRAVNAGIQALVMGSAGGYPRVLPTTPFIQKPFTLKALADRVRAVLDSGEGRN